MLRYREIKKDQILLKYAAFANEIVPTYGHCTHDGTNKLWTFIDLVAENRIQFGKIKPIRGTHTWILYLL